MQGELVINRPLTYDGTCSACTRVTSFRGFLVAAPSEVISALSMKISN